MEAGAKSSPPCPLPRRIACTSGSKRFNRMVVTGNCGDRGFSTLFVRISRFAIASRSLLCRADSVCAHENPSSTSAVSRNHFSATNSNPGRDSARSKARTRSAQGSEVDGAGFRERTRSDVGATPRVCSCSVLISGETSWASRIGSKKIRMVSPDSGRQLSADAFFFFLRSEELQSLTDARRPFGISGWRAFWRDRYSEVRNFARPSST